MSARAICHDKMPIAIAFTHSLSRIDQVHRTIPLNGLRDGDLQLVYTCILRVKEYVSG